MAYITKRGSSYSVRYTYQDEHGKSCDKWESFPTKEEAVKWGLLIKSPVPVEAPKKTTQERSIWEVDEMRAALDSMEDPILHLTLVGALREGEVAGLTPEDIDFDAANGMGTFTVNRSMQRVQKDTPVRICW